VEVLADSLESEEPFREVLRAAVPKQNTTLQVVEQQCLLQ
jgi:hypothetical protein